MLHQFHSSPDRRSGRLRRFAAAAVVGLCTAAVLAASASALFSGERFAGHTTQSYRGVAGQIKFTAARRYGVRGTIDDLYRCNDPRVPVYATALRYQVPLKVRARGPATFALHRSFRASVGRGVTGRFRPAFRGSISGNRAHGTLSSTLTVFSSNGKRIATCHAGLIRWTATGGR